MKAVLIVFQLVLSGIFNILLDDMLTKGYGLGNGIQAFIGTNICGAVLIKALGFSSVTTSNGLEYEGAIINFFYAIFGSSNKVWAIWNAFFRDQAPNLIGFVATLAVLLIMIYVQSYRVQIFISARKARGYKQPYPISLLYVKSEPILIHTAVLSNFYFFTYLL